MPTQAQAKLAEVRFPKQGIVLYGSVTWMQQDQIAIRLQTVPTDAELLRPKTPVDITVVAKNSIYMSHTRIVSQDSGTLILVFGDVVRTVQRRTNARYSCEIPVAFRTVRANGCTSGWQNAVTIDIGIGGMGLKVHPTVSIPSQIEAMFVLPDQMEGKMPERLYSDNVLEIANGREDRAIKVIARVCHSRPRLDGYLAVGLHFSKVSPFDRIRIARFLGSAA